MAARTCGEAIIEAIQAKGGRARKRDIETYIEGTYPGKWGANTITAHLYSHMKAKLVRGADCTFTVRALGGLAPSSAEPISETRAAPEPVEEVPDLGAVFSLERDLEDYLVAHLDQLEKGLRLAEGGRQYDTEAGRIDLLAEDRRGNLVVIELKAGIAQSAVIGQTLSYIAWLKRDRKEAKGVRAIIVASDFDQRVILAASQFPDLALMRYGVKFEFEAQPKDV